ncbi:MAG TPA: hypothetical protein VIH99_08045 [Bdellovibrionota bacterium]
MSFFKAVIVVVVFSALGSASSAQAKPQWLDDTCRRDACLHAAVAYGLTLTGSELLLKKAKLSPMESMLYSSGTVLLLGILKEAVIDDKWDGRDMTANAVGVAAGAGMFWVLEF